MNTITNSKLGMQNVSGTYNYNNATFSCSGSFTLLTTKCCLCKKEIELGKEKSCGNNEYECPECWEIIEKFNKKNV